MSGGEPAGREPWTGRRRLLVAFDCGIPDRVPINTYEMAGRNAGDWYWQQPSYAPLMEFIRSHTDCITNWNPEPVGDNFLGSNRFLGSDHPLELETRTESTDGFTRTTCVLHTPLGDLRSVTQSDPNVHTTWQVEHWCKSVEDVERALSVPYLPATYDASDLGSLRAEIGDHGIIMASLEDPAYLAADLMSFQDYLLWVVEETDHYARTVEILAERVRENLRRQLDCCVLDSYRICGPEYMTPPYLPPALFRRFMMPHVRWMTETLHERGARVRLHCHGKIARVLEMILETGCDGLDPCEPPPDGDLELAEVKRRCLARGVSVWGNIELKLLETATPMEVRAEVCRILEDAKEGGGFVLLPTAAPISVPLSPRTEENYRAFIEAGLDFGRY
jgi:uroporphyrinogen-III decarboxylase